MLTVFPIEKQKFSPNKTLVSNSKLSVFPQFAKVAKTN